jgi:ABC-type uncharacterized transport system substrate-binding protein
VRSFLAAATAALQRETRSVPIVFAAVSDPLDKLIESDTELEHYARSAPIAVTGEAD